MSTQALTYKYRLNPIRAQHRALEAILEQNRQLANAALAEREDFYRKNREAFLNARTHKQQCALYRKRIWAWIKTARKSEKKNDTATFLTQVSAAIKLFREYREFRKCKPPVPKSITAVDQSKSLTLVRQESPAFALVQRRIQRNTLNEVDRSYQATFRRLAAGQAPGFPHYKGRDYFCSFGFDAFQQIALTRQVQNPTLTTKARRNGARYGRIRFAGMAGGLRVWLDRELPSDPKRVWFKKEDGRWFIGFQVERDCAPLRTSGKEIGVDWGTSVIAALSTGEEIANPRFGERAADEYACAQRRVARAKRGSKRRRKAKIQERRVARKTANRRKNFVNKLTKRLTMQFKMVATEEFSVQAMMASKENEYKGARKRKNRETLDAAPYMTRQMIAYKARLYGSEHGLGGAPDTDKRSSTTVCSMCWADLTVSLSDHRVNCASCGNSLPRKVNAARVKMTRAMNRGGPVPADAKPGNSSVCPGNTGVSGKPRTSGRRPSGLPFNARTRTVASG